MHGDRASEQPPRCQFYPVNKTPRHTKHYVSKLKEWLIDEDTLARANAEWLASAKHTIAGLAPVPKGFTRDWTGPEIWAAYRTQEDTQ